MYRYLLFMTGDVYLSLEDGSNLVEWLVEQVLVFKVDGLICFEHSKDYLCGVSRHLPHNQLNISC